MPHGTYMGERNLGFLWDDERAYVEAFPKVPPSATRSEPTPDFDSNEVANPTQVGHRIGNGPASPEGLGEILEEVQADLELIERYWYDAKIAEDGRFEFDTIVLPANKDRIKKLHTLLGDWLERADSDQLKGAQQELNEKLEPLRRDLSDNDTQEYQDRLDALTALIRDSDLRDLLEWIQRHPGKKIRKGEDRRWLASRKLRTMYGLVENDGPWDHLYRLTERGDAVYTTLQALGEPGEGFPESEEERLKEWLSRIEYHRTPE